MDKLLDRRHGAVKFTEPIAAATQHCGATIFSKPDVDCVDDGWNAAESRLNSFYHLDDDWDGNGSVAPETELIEMALTLASRLRDCLYPAPDRVIAGINGSVSFEFVATHFTEIEIVSPILAEVYEEGKLIKTLHASA